jgi:methylated-DNA-[protein]-cysteine S-methyltransferase
VAAVRGYRVFDTALGRCAVAWSDAGIAGAHLPEGPDGALEARLRKRYPGVEAVAPPSAAQLAMVGVAELLSGAPRDLTEVPLDMDGVPDFHQRVYVAARAIPPGRTATYGEIAFQLDTPGAARAVGQALGRNPFAPIVPCHRVLAAGGKLGGFSAAGGIATKLELLAIEGAIAARPAGLFDDDPHALGFDRDAAVAHLRMADPVLRREIDAVGAFRMQRKREATVFAALAEAIVYQQLHGRAAATIFARLRALFPHAHLAPTPEQIVRVSDEKLRAAGLSRPKIAALRDLAARAARGELPTLAEIRTLDDDEIVERLTVVRGIGRWTVEMLLMFRLGRPDVLPVDDYGIRKGFALAFGTPELPMREALLERGERWRPYRTAASWYLWRVAERAPRDD